MSRYRKIDSRIWGDEKFRTLSKPKPNAQSLWLYLLTGPHTNGCPGLFNVGPMSVSESLGWSLKAFHKAFQEVFDKGMVKADFEARVILIPNAIKYDPPENPNVLKKWAKDYDEIPECELKTEYYEILKAFIKGFNEAFMEVFDKDFAKSITITRTITNTITNTITKPLPKSFSDGFDDFWISYPKKIGKQKTLEIWIKIKPDQSLLKKMLEKIELFKQTDQWKKDRGQFIPHPATWLNQERWEDEIDVKQSDKDEYENVTGIGGKYGHTN